MVERNMLMTSWPTQQELHDRLDYDPATGRFLWKNPTNNHHKQGDHAGGRRTDSRGYLQLGLNGRLFLQHRLVWLYVHDTLPSGQIDHIDGCKTNNRLENLRDVCRSTNLLNQTRAHCNSKSGYLGVDWHPRSNKWRAQLKVKGVKKTIGYFSTAEEASSAYTRAKKEVTA